MALLKIEQKFSWIPTKTDHGWIWFCFYKAIYKWEYRTVYKERERVDYGLGYEEPILEPVSELGWVLIKKEKQ